MAALAAFVCSTPPPLSPFLLWPTGWLRSTLAQLLPSFLPSVVRLRFFLAATTAVKTEETMKVYSGLVLAAAVVTGAAAAAQTTAQPSVSVVITQGVTTTLVMPAWASSVFTETGAPSASTNPPLPSPNILVGGLTRRCLPSCHWCPNAQCHGHGDNYHCYCRRRRPDRRRLLPYGPGGVLRPGLVRVVRGGSCGRRRPCSGRRASGEGEAVWECVCVCVCVAQGKPERTKQGEANGHREQNSSTEPACLVWEEDILI